MKIFEYQGLSESGEKQVGRIESVSKDSAIETLQHRGIVITLIKESGVKDSLGPLSFLNKIPAKEIVFMARQISTLFEANVSAYKAFTLIGEQATHPVLKQQLQSVTSDLSSGSTISQALSQYPETFSNFFVNMVRAGEESGKLSDTFMFLADYMERQYELTRKTRSALIYPVFVIIVFFSVMVLMMRFIIPKLGEMITQSEQAIPVFTKIILTISSFFVDYGLILLVLFLVFVTLVVMFLRSPKGKAWKDEAKITTPILKNLYQKLYLARIADNLDTMLSSGIPIIRTLEVTASVVDNSVYERILTEVSEEVKSGISLSNALSKHSKIPVMLSQMVRVGEETGMLGQVLRTLGKFYRREVDQAVDTLVALIEPVMIIVLGLGVGVLLVSVLMPIYNIASGF
jgi:type IV pilus assembly protein PilC